MSDWKEDALRHKYDPLPEDSPRHRKKTKKKHVRSDHKHDYETVCIDTHSYLRKCGVRRKYYSLAKRCKICGRIGDMKMWTRFHEPPEDMPLYDVVDFWTMLDMKTLPEEMRVK